MDNTTPARAAGGISRRSKTTPGRARRPVLLALAAASIALSLAGAPGTAGATARPDAAAMVSVKVATVAKYGKILEDQAGYALYFNKDNKPPAKWACSGKCLVAWPPLLLAKAQAKPAVGKGVTAIGTVMSPSGDQVTWHGQPLYTFIKDTPGTVKGQGIKKIWYVAQLSAVSPSGGIAY